MRHTGYMLMILTTASIVIGGSLVYGCECIELTVADAFKHAAVVFQGTVVQIDHLNPIQPPDAIDGQHGPVALVPMPRSVNDQTLVTFSVTTAWKGPVTEAMKVFAVARPSMCDGYRFQPKVEYIVYASKNLDQNWKELQPFKKGAFVYDVADCPLRVRTDVAAEAGRLAAPLRRFSK
jgi:hypothetical protein